MALPLKSGADLYNNQALRLRLHNLGADPTEVGAGLIYFNTSTGLNTSQKVRLYTGSAWKTIAFSEDLDVASNADFLALKDKVDLLSGDVDTDAIISNMKEVSAFLEGFEEDASLMDYLNTELGKKLDLTGGTIKGVVVLNGNGATNVPLNIATPSMGNTGYIRFGAGISANELGHLGFSAKGEPAMVYEGTVHPLLHSGNVGEYAVKYDNGASIDAARHSIGYDNGNRGSDNFPIASGGGGYISFGHDSYGCQFLGNSNGLVLYYRGFENNAFSNWKTIAFTDSNVASAQALQTSGGVKFAEFAESTVYIGSETYQNYNTSILGKTVRLYSGNASLGLILNFSGNVTIGGSDLASSDYKLFVYGNSVFADVSRKGDINTTKISSSAIVEITAIAKGNDGLYIGQLANSTAWLQSAYGGTDANASSNHTYPLSLQPLGGNVLIGTTTDDGSGAKLQVKGDLYVEGNIIATKEVSAGGAAEEGGNAGGGGAFHSESIAVGATQTTIAHGLGTDDIVVSIYEKDGVSGRWSIILTDVEIVDANNIIVSFGSATSVEHKVVIMGAVA